MGAPGSPILEVSWANFLGAVKSRFRNPDGLKNFPKVGLMPKLREKGFATPAPDLVKTILVFVFWGYRKPRKLTNKKR